MSVTLTVNRVGGTTATSTVSYTTANGSAIGGRDFTILSGTLTFLAGESSKTITVPLIKSAVAADGIYFTLILSSPTGGVILDTPSVAQISLYE